jgi:hypothetical protein
VVGGALHRRRRAPGVGGVKDLKRVSGENLLSVEWAAHAADIYIGDEMLIQVLEHNVHLLQYVEMSMTK